MKQALLFRHPSVVVSVIVALVLLFSSNLLGLHSSPTLALSSTPPKHHAPTNNAVLTFKNDVSRTGLDPNETILTTTNVNASQFGKHIVYSVDGQVYAQPLYVPNLTIGGAAHNVVFAETEHDSVYAFDADQISSSTSTNALWHTSFINPPNITTLSSNDVSCTDVTPEVGITGTPVIDPATSTMYLVAATKENGKAVNRLHALDITTGNEKPGSPVQITMSGGGSFDAIHERQRAGLLLANGAIYIAWGSYCDNDPYHGLIMGYTYNGTAFQQVSFYNDTANGSRAGIWHAGGGIAADGSGNLYAMSGNGTFDLNTGGVDAGDSFIKLSPQLKVLDSFTPFNQSCLSAGDVDLGSGGPLLLPTQGGSTPNEVIGVGKEGRIYVVNRDSMGKFTADSGLNCTTTEQNRTDIDKVVQELPPQTAKGGVWGTFALWNGPNGQFVYISGATDHLKAFQVTNGRLSTSATSQSPESWVWPGSDPIVSSDGTTAGTGIVWTIDPSGVLHAYDASNLANELYSTAQDATRDGLDSFVKFSVPTIANGEAFVGTQKTLSIFGEVTAPPPTNTLNNIGISNDSSPKAANYDTSGNSYSAQALQGAGITPGHTVTFNGVSFTWPNVAAGVADNFTARWQTLAVTPISGATTLAFLGSATFGSSSGVAIIHYTDGSNQPFTLGLTDWAVISPSFGNGVVATMSYRNTPTGKQTIKVAVFYTSVPLLSGKTLQSVTLPAFTGSGQVHVFALSTGAPPAASYNNTGTSNDSAPSAADFDGAGNSYSAQAFQGAGITPGGTFTYNNVTFTWPNAASGSPNNYQANGQTIPVTPVSGATSVAFLGSATNGPSTGTVTINFTDGTTQTAPLGLSDWTLNAGTGSLLAGNSVAVVLPYRNTHTGKQTENTYIFYTAISLMAGKTVSSVTLPFSVNAGHLHVFAIGTSTNGGLVAFNNPGTSDDSNPKGANYDHVGGSFSAQALHTAGIIPGGVVKANGVTFTWTTPGSGLANNYEAHGQTIFVPRSAGTTTLAFLGSATNGTSSGTITVTYSDGTTQTFTLGFTDWTSGSPLFGNTIVTTMPYRNLASGKENIKVYVYYAAVTIQAGKFVQSVTLPSSTTGGLLHIFSVGTK